jgi:hypothetical protein
MGLRVPVWARQSSSHTASALSGRSTYPSQLPSVRAEPFDRLRTGLSKPSPLHRASRQAVHGAGARCGGQPCGLTSLRCSP